MVKHGQGEIGIRSLDDCKTLGLDENKNSIDDDDDPFRPLPGPYVKACDSKKKIKGSARQAVVALNMRVSIRFLFYLYSLVQCILCSSPKNCCILALFSSLFLVFHLKYLYQDWRDMCRAFGVVKGDLPHRANSKYSCPVNSSPS